MPSWCTRVRSGSRDCRVEDYLGRFCAGVDVAERFHDAAAWLLLAHPRSERRVEGLVPQDVTLRRHGGEELIHFLAVFLEVLQMLEHGPRLRPHAGLELCRVVVQIVAQARRHLGCHGFGIDRCRRRQAS